MKALKQYLLKSCSGHAVTVSEFGLVDYAESLEAMREFASKRAPEEQDQIWLLQHPSIYTQGTSCTQVPLSPSDIPLIKTDRGGQITYHGPGQIVMYPQLNIRRYQLGVKALVAKLEQAVLDVLATDAIEAHRRDDAPGVYVKGAKVAALGLRLRRGNSYHGLSLNVDMDLSPFANIDPCGYQGLEVTQMRDLGSHQANLSTVSNQLLKAFLALI